ncbi:MAG: hypothetical protein ACF8LL_13410 [Phycisphaerales bacterium]
MSTQIEHNELVRLPAMLIGAISLVCCALIALGGGYLSTQRGGAMSDGLNTLIAMVPGVLIPAAILMIMPPKPAGVWAVPVLALTVLRAMIAMGIGFAIFMLIDPSKTVFFMTLLASLLVTLSIDVASVLFLIQKHAPAMNAARESEGVC